MKFVVQIIEARAPPPDGREGGGGSPIIAHDGRHNALRRIQGSLHRTSAPFQSVLLLPVELKLLGSFMRLILPEHVTKGLTPRAATAFIFAAKIIYTGPSFLSCVPRRNGQNKYYHFRRLIQGS